MGVDTKLLISSRWSIENIKDILKVEGIEAKIKDHSEISSTYLSLLLDNGRMIHCHYNTITALGRAFLLSMHSDEESIQIFRTIAEITGGFLNKEDVNDDFEEIRGILYDDDGLAFFLKYAAINGHLADNDDLQGLQQVIENWRKKHPR